MDIPLYIYKYLLGLSILVVLLFSFTQYFKEDSSRLMKIALGWFTVLMVANIVNMIVTLNHYEKNSDKIGAKGPQGIIGPKGFKGKGDTCGSICGKEGAESAELMANEINDNGEPDLSNKIKPGKCIFPFVHNYQNIYSANGCVTDSPPEMYPDMPLPDPESGKKGGGWCATELNRDKTPKKVGYCGESNKELAAAEFSRRQAEKHDRFIENNTGILDIKLISGNRSSIECPSGYTKVSKDLNEGSGGAYVFMCKKNGLGSKGVKSIKIAKNDEKCEDLLTGDDIISIKKLKTDLNKDTNVSGFNPEKLFMCLGYSDSSFLTDVKVTNEFGNAGEGFEIVNSNSNPVNLNEATDGTDLFLYTSDTRTEVNPIDTAFFYPKEKKLYFLGGPDGKYFYTYLPNKGKTTSAELTKNKFGRLPNNLDAAFTWNYDEKTYFFKGKYVYKFDSKRMKIADGFPKSISLVFTGIPNNIDAVFSWDKDNNTYFFKDKFLYKYDSEKKRVANGYPRLITARFPGAPVKIDAVYHDTNENKTYFVRANDYYILDSSEKVPEGYPQKLNLKYPGLNVVPTVNSFFTALGLGSKLYFFSPNKYFKYNTTYDLEETKEIEHRASDFLGIPKVFDCALNFNELNEIMIFHGTKVIKYNTDTRDIDSGYPKDISEEFPEIPNNLDASIKYINDIYFFKNNLVYKVPINDESQLDTNYPKKIGDIFDGLPDNLDAFVFFNGIHFAVKGIQYYEVDMSNFKVKTDSPKYLDKRFKKLDTAADRKNIIG